MVKLKLAERFISVQGEGLWAGVPMAFLRLSHCPVGGPEGICKTPEGKPFVCDTGKAYHKAGGAEWHAYSEVNEQLDGRQVWQWVIQGGCQHLVLTGGEPLSYDLSDIQQYCPDAFMMHIETSGTVYNPVLEDSRAWITVSPKFDYLPRVLKTADEVKILVDRETTEGMISKWIALIGSDTPLLLQPIEDAYWKENVAHTMELCLRFARVARLSTQTHKYLAVR